MDAASLRALQAPLKARYRDDPAAALVTLRAEGDIADASIACKLETGRVLVTAGLHPASGGTGFEACSGDMLLEALVACAGVTLKAVATALDVKLKAAHVVAEGDLDFRGTLGVDRGAGRLPRYTPLFNVDSDAPQEKPSVDEVDRAVCVVPADYARRPPVSAVLTFVDYANE